MNSNLKREQASEPKIDRTKFADAIETLLASLPPNERAAVIKLLSERISPNPRAGGVLGVVVRLFKEKPQWAADELRQQLPLEGVPATPKEVYNALGYLKRRNQIKKVGYGQYILTVDSCDTSRAARLPSPQL